MASTATLNGIPTEDAALGYTLDPPGGTVVSQAWESSTDGTNWTAIPGATGATFTPGDEEVGKSLRVVVQVEEGSGPPSAAASNAAVVANVNDAPTGSLAVSGAATQGEKLTTNDGVSDPDGATGPRSYKWQSSADGTAWTDIADATGTEFTLTQATVGRFVRAVVGFTDDRGQAETVASAATATPVADANIAPGGTLTVEGTLRVGQTVTMADLVFDEDGIPDGGRSYQWQASADGGTTWANLEGASGNTPFLLTEAQRGQSLRAVLTYTDGDGKAETVLGTASAPVAAAGNSAPTGAPVLGYGAGDAPVEDAAITVDASGVADADGLGAFAYAWSREGANGAWTAIAGATASSYTPGDADVGARLKVEASYTDGAGNKEAVSAVTAAAVANVNDAPTGAIAFSGQAVRGRAVAASTDALADADGIGPISLRWERADGDAWTPIAGATAAAYTPVEADVGRELRAVATWTDKQGTAEQVVGDAGVVAAGGKAVALPPPGPGETQENAAADEWTSVDLAKMIAEGGTFTPPAGVERIELADGALSYGTGTAEAFVARLYLGLLGREGDVGGLSFAAEALENGASRGTLADAFLSGAEYKALQGAAQTDAAFVEGLYDAFLGRDGAAGELGFWTGAMANGAPRGEVAAAIAGSAEAGARMEAATYGVFVADFEGASARGLYECALGREGEAAGVRYWSDVLELGADLKALGDGFDDTPEFVSRHGALTNREYVEKLYQDGLGRTADAGGLDYWTGLLDSGRLGRGELAVGYATSQEVRDGLDWPL